MILFCYYYITKWAYFIIIISQNKVILLQATVTCVQFKFFIISIIIQIKFHSIKS